jgi:hypothetical protein
MNHTPTPWTDKESKLIGGDGRVIARLMPPETIFSSVKRADVDRIVACVNACEGIADPAEAIMKSREALRDVLGALEAMLAERPMLAAKRAGCTTVGNHRAAVASALKSLGG